MKVGGRTSPQFCSLLKAETTVGEPANFGASPQVLCTVQLAISAVSIDFSQLHFLPDTDGLVELSDPLGCWDGTQSKRAHAGWC